MPANNHKISKSDALRFAKAFNKKKADGKETLKDVPDGFLFNADEVKQLISHPKATSFVIRFGWKKTDLGHGIEKEIICPILMVLDDQNRVIEGNGENEFDGLAALKEENIVTESGGGYLDEAQPIPPPNIDFGDD